MNGHGRRSVEGAHLALNSMHHPVALIAPST